MPANNVQGRFRRIGRGSKEGGVAAVEFALVAIVFFTMVFGIIEFARLMYVYNSLAEVTRSVAHAAANIDFREDGQLNDARKRALFDETSGKLPFGDDITYEKIRIEYLYLGPKGTGVELQPVPAKPTCPAKNRLNCMANSSSKDCIRAVQARICAEGQTGTTCTPIKYTPLFGLIELPVNLPTSTTIVAAETLGYQAGDTPCP